MHKLLARQLERAAGDSSDGAVDYDKLLAMVSAAYARADRESQRARQARRDQRHETEALARLRNSEAQLRAVIDNSPAKVLIKDLEGRFVLLNKCGERLTGIPEAAAIGKRVEDLFAGPMFDRFLDNDRYVLETGQVVHQEEVWQQPEGRRDFLSIKFPIRDASGRISGICAIGTDVTEHKRTVAALRQSKEQADLANRSKSEFLANMSHELRTPLNAIIGFSDVIRACMHGPVGSPKYVEYADDINRSGLHLLELINDILDLSKIEAGEVELQEEATDIAATAGSCLTLVRERAEAGRVTVALEMADDLPPLFADPRRLKQILINLLSNAIKFTPAGGSVTVTAAARPGEGLELSVVDTGIGMAEEQIPVALTPFRQVDSSLSRRFDGTGLGLPLTKSLVEMHGGSLLVASTVGAGTAVTVRFPPGRVMTGGPARDFG